MAPNVVKMASMMGHRSKQFTTLDHGAAENDRVEQEDGYSRYVRPRGQTVPLMGGQGINAAPTSTAMHSFAGNYHHQYQQPTAYGATYNQPSV